MPYGTGKFDSIENSTGNSVDLTSMVSTEATGTDKGYMSAADKSKLDGVETGATADQTGAEIKAAYENEADTNAFTDAEKTKLAGVEENATSDQTGAEIKAAYEAEADTNAYDDAAVAKLAGIEVGATADQTGAEIKSAYEAEADTNAYTDADKTKLDAIESGATADQTGAEIKSAYEGEADTNAFTDAEKSKLAGIEAGATADQTVADLGLENVDNTSDANKPISTATQTALDAKADLVGGVLDTSQLPDIAVSEYKGAVADQTAMLAITGEKGDWVIRNDDSKVYVITGTNPASASDWTALSYPAGFSGAYSDLTGTPTIPTNNNQLTNGAGYITSADGGDAATLDGIDSTGFLYRTLEDSDRNFIFSTSSTSNGAGIEFRRSDSTFQGQIYADGNSTGFLTSSWGTWDLIKDHNGSLTLRVGGANYTVAPISTGTYNGTYNIPIHTGDLLYPNPAAGGVTITGSTGQITTPSHGNSSQWNTAYGWGDHASAGYITSADGGNAATLDGIDSTSFLRSDTSDTYTQLNSSGSTNNARFLSGNSWGTTHQTDNGYIQFGPANDSHAHIYTDRPNFYFNAPLQRSGNTVWDSGNDGSGSGLDADTVDGIHSSGLVQTTYNSGLNSDSRNSRGVTRLFRRDDDSDYSVQTYWTGSHWMLYGYNGDTAHAPCRVNYAESLNGFDWASSGKNVRASEFYADNWFRNYNSGEGLYNEANTMYWYSTSTSSWKLRSNQSTVNIAFATSSDTTRGYVYANNSSEIGFLNSAGSWSLKCDNSGNVTATANVTAYSDIRLKSDIEPITNALEKVEQINGVTYTRIDSGERQTGLIAQEVEKVMPEAVMDGEEYKSVAYGNLVGLLVEAVKELKEEVKGLKAEVATLKQERN